MDDSQGKHLHKHALKQIKQNLHHLINDVLWIQISHMTYYIELLALYHIFGNEVVIGVNFISPPENIIQNILPEH